MPLSLALVWWLPTVLLQTFPNYWISSKLTQCLQSTSSQVEQDGCPNGVSDRIDTGSPPLSQYDAAGRNACPTQVEQHNRRSDRATTKALTVTQHQLETLRSHLERLRMRLDRLDGGLDAEKKQ